MHVLVADGELVEIAGIVIHRAAQPLLLARQDVGHVAEGTLAIRQVELPARGMRNGARIPQPVAALDQRRLAMGMAQGPILVEPADMPDLPEHGIDDIQARAHQFRP
jgi:hypothetical protein